MKWVSRQVNLCTSSCVNVLHAERAKIHTFCPLASQTVLKIEWVPLTSSKPIGWTFSQWRGGERCCLTARRPWVQLGEEGFSVWGSSGCSVCFPHNKKKHVFCGSISSWCHQPNATMRVWSAGAAQQLPAAPQRGWLKCREQLSPHSTAHMWQIKCLSSPIHLGWEQSRYSESVSVIATTLTG